MLPTCKGIFTNLPPHRYNYDRLNVIFRAFKANFDSSNTQKLVPIFTNSLRPFLHNGSALTRLAVDPLLGTLTVDGFIWNWSLEYIPNHGILRLVLPNDGFFYKPLDSFYSGADGISKTEFYHQASNWVSMTEEQILFFPDILSFIDAMYTIFASDHEVGIVSNYYVHIDIIVIL